MGNRTKPLWQRHLKRDQIFHEIDTLAAKQSFFSKMLELEYFAKNRKVL